MDRHFVYYGCNSRFRMREIGCPNKQLSKPFIEKFVLEHLAEYVFNEEYVQVITAEYNAYLGGQKDEIRQSLKAVTQRLNAVENELHSVTELLVMTQAPSMIEKLEALEREKVELTASLEQLQKDKETTHITEDEVKTLFAEIRKKFLSGELKSIKQIIDAYVHRIDVHPDTVTVYFNFFSKITLAYAQEKPEGCEISQPSGSTDHVLPQTLVQMAENAAIA